MGIDAAICLITAVQGIDVTGLPHVPAVDPVEAVAAAEPAPSKPAAPSAPPAGVNRWADFSLGNPDPKKRVSVCRQLPQVCDVDAAWRACANQAAGTALHQADARLTQSPAAGH